MEAGCFVPITDSNSMALETAPLPPRKKAVKKSADGTTTVFSIRHEMPSRNWFISELLQLYFDSEELQAAMVNAKKDILLKLLDMTGTEEDEQTALFLPDIDDIENINKYLSIIQVDSLITKAMAQRLADNTSKVIDDA